MYMSPESASSWKKCQFCKCPTPALKAHEAECLDNPINRPCMQNPYKICGNAVLEKFTMYVDERGIKCDPPKRQPVLHCKDCLVLKEAFISRPPWKLSDTRLPKWWSLAELGRVNP